MKLYVRHSYGPVTSAKLATEHDNALHTRYTHGLSFILRCEFRFAMMLLQAR